MSNALHEQVRSIIREHGRLGIDVGTLAADADLYQAGLSSHATVNLMLGLEEAFDVEFPERMLRRRVFESVTAISGAVDELVRERGGQTPQPGLASE